MGARRQSREIAMQILHSMDTCGLTHNEAWSAFFGMYEKPKIEKTMAFAVELIDGVTKNKDDIDKYISQFAKNWDIARMASVDRTIIRIASFELLYLPDIPVSVVINEAVEIAKSFSTSDSGKFVNGVLDKIKKKRKKDEE
ncbi:MAG: transcription antitermination factor NusB [Elusimicrobiota bacterium]